MTAVTLWIALGLTLLAWNGIEETIASLMIDFQGNGERSSEGMAQVYCALCLTLLVVVWPIVMMDMLESNREG